MQNVAIKSLILLLLSRGLGGFAWKECRLECVNVHIGSLPTTSVSEAIRACCMWIQQAHECMNFFKTHVVQEGSG